MSTSKNATAAMTTAKVSTGTMPAEVGNVPTKVSTAMTAAMSTATMTAAASKSVSGER